MCGLTLYTCNDSINVMVFGCNTLVKGDLTSGFICSRAFLSSFLIHIYIYDGCSEVALVKDGFLFTGGFLRAILFWQYISIL